MITPEYQKWLAWQRQNQQAPDIAAQVASAGNISPYAQLAVSMAKTAAGAINPMAGGIISAGDTLSKLVRNNNQYGVAASDAQAFAGGVLDPTKSLARQAEGAVDASADAARMGLDVLQGDWAGAKKQGKRFLSNAGKVVANMIPGLGDVLENREKKSAQQEAEQQARNWQAAQRLPNTPQKTYRPPQAYYNLNMNQRLLNQQFTT